jgi:choline dehydrogenase-like flavoprotein
MALEVRPNNSCSPLSQPHLNPHKAVSINHETVPNPYSRCHASCSNKMGRADDPMAVVDNNFSVYGTENLRVIDASVLPRILRFLIVSSVDMIAEKASNAILADAKQISA